MPARKAAAVAAAALVAAALIGGAALLLASGRQLAGGMLLAATAVATIGAAQAVWARFDLTGSSLRRGPRRGSLIALTFDDGPGPDTPAVLDALDRAGVKATFFVLGCAAAEHPEWVREIASRGHLVALHGHSHRKLLLAGPARVRSEIDRGRDAVTRAGVVPAPFFRAPHGWKGPFLGRALRRRGLRLVGWTRGAWDTERPGATAIADRLCRRAQPGDILLLHDGSGTPGIDPRRDQTARAIPEIVQRCRSRGLRFVTVDVLAAARPPRGWGTRWVGVAVVAALAVVAARRVDPEALRHSLSAASLPLLAAAAGADVAALAFQAARWRALVEPAVGRVGFRDAFVALVAGFAVGLAVPARASDLARVHLLARRSRSSFASLAGTAAIDHLVGGTALLVLLALAPLAAPLPPWAARAGAAALAVGAAAAVAVWLLRPRRPDALERTGIGALAARLRSGLRAAGEPRALAASLAFAFAGWGAEVAIAVFCLDAFGLPASPEVALLVVLATSLSSAISVSPGNTGVFELAAVLVLAGLGIPREPALAFALGYHAVHLAVVGLVGGGAVLFAGHHGRASRDVS